MKQIIDLDGKSSGGNEDAIVFARSGKMQIPQTVATSTSRCSTPSEPPGIGRIRASWVKCAHQSRGVALFKTTDSIRSRNCRKWRGRSTNSISSSRSKTISTSGSSSWSRAWSPQFQLQNADRRICGLERRKAFSALIPVNATGDSQETPRSNPRRTGKKAEKRPWVRQL